MTQPASGTCPYLDLEAGLCSIEFEPCAGKRQYPACEQYSHERQRLRAVVAQCRYATRRRRRDGGGGPTLDHQVWCHSPGTEAHICYAWPAECPVLLASRVAELEQRLDGRYGMAECPQCGERFVPRDQRQIYCTRRCSQAASRQRCSGRVKGQHEAV